VCAAFGADFSRQMTQIKVILSLHLSGDLLAVWSMLDIDGAHDGGSDTAYYCNKYDPEQAIINARD
jgi:hypothetical protein